MTTFVAGLLIFVLQKPQLLLLPHVTGPLAVSQQISSERVRAIRLELHSSSYREGKPVADIAGAIRSKLAAGGFKVTTDSQTAPEAILQLKYEELKGRAFSDGYITNIAVKVTLRHPTGPAVLLDKTIHVNPVGNLVYALMCPPWCDEKSAYTQTIQRLNDHPVFMYLADYVKGALRMTTDTEGSILVSALQSNEVGTMEEAVRQLMFEVPAADRADVVPLLIGLLRSSKASAASRSKAAVVLGHYKATDVLIEVLGDPGHRDVQQAVAEALGTAADRRAVDKLVNALLENPDRDVRHAAATALGRIGDPRAVDALIKSLKDKYLEYAAAGALGHLKDARSVEPLIQVLKSANNGARAASATALGSIGDLRALEALEELSRSDPDDFVRKAATEAVRVLRGDRIIIRDERVSRSEGYPDWGDRR
jgi:hypothetical protein